MTTTLLIEYEREADNRHIAEIPAIPGCHVYGATKREALARVVALAMDIEGEPSAVDAPARDPRVDPKAGDVLVGAYRTRAVEKIDMRFGRFGEQYVFWRCPTGGGESASVKAWRKWAQRARVEKVAP